MNNDYLCATPFFNFDQPAVRQWADTTLAGVNDDPISIAKALYLRARDSIHYNPYTFSSDPETLAASYILGTGESYCIPKAILLGAAARYKGIPSRLGLADVKNHLSSPKLIEWLRSDIFRMHGYIELLLNGKWVKATPAFNTRLCQRMGVEPLEFDGVNDSIFQENTGGGRQHMEYINDYGTFAEVPFEFIDKNIRNAYPHLFSRDADDFKGRTLESEL